MSTHKNNTKDFDELSYAEQARSITAQINNLENAIQHHHTHAPTYSKDQAEVKTKCVGQVERLLDRVRNI